MSTQKLALVTGAMGGIGTAICRRLRANNVKVIASYLEGVDPKDAWLEELKKEGITDIGVVSGNVGDWASCVEMGNKVRKDFGDVNILVNNAGITKDGFFKKMTVDKWDAVIKVNMNSVFYVTKQFYDQMLDKKWGRIINISSMNGEKGQAGQCNYAATKAGVHGFTMSLAQECADKGITVNTICPGYVATPMVKAIKPEILNSIVQSVPMKRLGEPMEIAGLVNYLASDEAAFMTGSKVSMNGGIFMSS